MKKISLILIFILTIFLSQAQTWSPVGSGLNNRVFDLIVYNAELYSACGFSSPGGVPPDHISRWNGTSWTNAGMGLSGDYVQGLGEYNGELFAGGKFYEPSVTGENIAKLSGTSWHIAGAFGPGSAGPVTDLISYNGELYIGGPFTSGGAYIARWNGSAWSSVGSFLNGAVTAFSVFNSDLYVGGAFTTAGSISTPHIAKWNGLGWSAIGMGMNGTVSSLVVYNSELYAAGNFTLADGMPANRIAKWNGTSWAALGAGVDTTVYALCVYNGELYVGGLFTSAGGTFANHIAKWNMPTGINENNLSSLVIAYPNPANNKIYLKDIDIKISEIKLFNTQGELLKNVCKSNTSEIDVSDLSSGIYILKIVSERNVISKKIVVQH